MVVRSSVSLEGIDEFIKKVDKASRGDLKREITLWANQMGLDFLDIVQQQIIANDNIDTQRLLSSFEKGDQDNVWVTSKDGMEIEIGTNVEYADWVNTGHWTVSKDKGQRWVPGRWTGSKFTYDPSAKTGMLLKRKWVEGSHYWDTASMIFEDMFDRKLDEKLSEWVDRYF